MATPTKKMCPVVHLEMPAEDKKRMSDFYTRVFGWETTQMGPEMGEYVVVTTTETDENRMIKTPGAINGGFFQKTKDNSSKHPSVVISVGDIKASIKDVKEAGGNVLGEPTEIPGIGQYVMFTDTEGNMSSMLQPIPR